MRMAAGARVSPPAAPTSASPMRATVSAAAVTWPCMSSHRGLSGTWRRTIRIAIPRTSAERRNTSRHPDRDREDARDIEQDHGQHPAEDHADPVAAVDAEVDLAADPRGHELVDRGVDRRVLAADAGAREEAKRDEHAEVFVASPHIAVAARYSASVTRNSRLRPSRSVR